MSKTFEYKVQSSTTTMTKDAEELYTLIWLYSDNEQTATNLYDTLARRVPVKCIDDLRRMSMNEIRQIKGIGPVKLGIVMDILNDVGCIVNVKNLKRIER